jgi:hypothetical protein
MIIEAKDVFFLSDVSQDFEADPVVLEERFGDAKFFTGKLTQVPKKFRAGIHILWFDSYEKFFLAKQFFLKKKKAYFAGFDKILDGESPWFIMASRKDFKNMQKWMDEQS